VQLADATGQIATTSLTFLIAAALSVTTTGLPSGTIGVPYVATLAASGGTPPLTWAVASGQLPTGLSLSSAGKISGTPSSAGSFTFIAQATDSGSPQETALQSYTMMVSSSTTGAGIHVNAGGPAYTDASGSIWQADTNFNGGLTFSTTHTITNTTEPVLYQSQRYTTGPLQYNFNVPNGNYLVTLKFAELYYTAPKQRVFDIALNGNTVQSSFDTLEQAGGPNVAIDTHYAVTVNGGQIIILLTPVIDAPAVNAIEIVPGATAITSAGPPTIFTSSLPNSNSGSAYLTSLWANGGTPPYSWSVTTGVLPAGLSLSVAGTISGIPTTAGTSSFTVELTDSIGQKASRNLNLAVVSNGPLTVTTNSLHLAIVQSDFDGVLTASGGVPPYLWAITSGALPAGMTLNSGTGQVSGSPTEGGQFSITVAATDANSATASKSLSLRVFEQPQDQYGGLINHPCGNGPQPRFYTQKENSRWYLCTPAGNAFFMQGVSNVQADASPGDLGISYQQAVTQKYGDSNYKWGNQITKRLLSWGFNAAVENTSTYVFPFGRPAGDTLMPISPVSLMSRYALTNAGNYAPDAMKSLLDTVDLAVYTGWVGSGSTPDVFDPNFDAYVNGRNAATLADPFWSQWFTSPWVIGVTLDDSDELFGIGPGLEQPGPDGVIHPHIGWLALASPPTKSSSSRYAWTYINSSVYSKQQIVADLRTKYSSISALNSAWGSNYTSFGSAGGWPKHLTHGTGLMDEDGSSLWLGTTDATLQGATAGVTRDLDEFLLKYWQKYFQVTRDRLKQYAPSLMLISPALNSHGGMTRKQIIQAAAEYCDLLAIAATSQSMLDTTAAYTGDKPYIFSQFIWSSNPDSSMWRYPNVYGQHTQTQADRANLYVNQSNFVAQAKITSTQTKPFIGLTFWDLTDSWAEKSNWGLVTFLDNVYDGQEAVITNGFDSWGFKTGGEERNYGVFIGPVTEANLNMLRAIAQGQ